MKTRPEDLLHYILYMLDQEPYELQRADTPEGQACLLNLQRIGGHFTILFTKEDVELMQEIEKGRTQELDVVTHIKNVIEKGVRYKNWSLRAIEIYRKETEK